MQMEELVFDVICLVYEIMTFVCFWMNYLNGTLGWSLWWRIWNDRDRKEHWGFIHYNVCISFFLFNLSPVLSSFHPVWLIQTSRWWGGVEYIKMSYPLFIFVFTDHHWLSLFCCCLCFGAPLCTTSTTYPKRCVLFIFFWLYCIVFVNSQYWHTEQHWHWWHSLSIFSIRYK